MEKEAELEGSENEKKYSEKEVEIGRRRRGVNRVNMVFPFHHHWSTSITTQPCHQHSLTSITILHFLLTLDHFHHHSTPSLTTRPPFPHHSTPSLTTRPLPSPLDPFHYHSTPPSPLDPFHHHSTPLRSPTSFD
ncbi:hypothetical protein Pmani_037018 [Petrolisthes manimaculis]|uniref:Uncharacterized protein n=1 Tax=Petrolisthes manimaculis TaxID=1843537 RepID=A0AAE1NIC3_9EUCA|nr:hypothetical protein Pmani_037018 [Petrolisthes manimaculis]